MRFDLLDEYASVYTLHCRAWPGENNSITNPDDPGACEVAQQDQGRTARRAALAVIALMVGLSAGTAYLGF